MQGMSTVGSHSDTVVGVQMPDLGDWGSLVHWEWTETAP